MEKDKKTIKLLMVGDYKYFLNNYKSIVWVKHQYYIK